jgi:hypothetical protein
MRITMCSPTAPRSRRNLGYLVSGRHLLTPAVRIGNPTTPTVELSTRDPQEAAQTLGLKLLVVRAATEGDLEPAFATLP